jgi:hypothetical protein
MIYVILYPGLVSNITFMLHSLVVATYDTSFGTLGITMEEHHRVPPPSHLVLAQPGI